ncbi:MAG: hypothetical protein AAF442_05040 [Pseudomonadota bacterium]
MSFVDVQTIRVQAITGVLYAAEKARLSLITPGDGKAYVYQAKLAEANAYQQDDDPQDNDYPILAAEAAALDITVASLAATVHQRATEITAQLARIEATTQAAKKKIESARTTKAIKKIIDTFAPNSQETNP